MNRIRGLYSILAVPPSYTETVPREGAFAQPLEADVHADADAEHVANIDPAGRQGVP